MIHKNRTNSFQSKILTLQQLNRGHIMPALNNLFKFFKDWSMPIAILIGIAFPKALNHLNVLIPYMIFIMFVLTFSNVKISNLRIQKPHIWLLSFQLFGSIMVYLTLLLFGKLTAESAFICVLGPTATSAAVIAGFLGGNVASLTTYTLLSNVMVSIAGPLLFPIINPAQDMTFLHSFIQIFSKVAPMLLSPLIVSWLFDRYAPKANLFLKKLHNWPFYLWTLSLAIVTGSTVCFLKEQQNPDWVLNLTIAGFSLLICILQFSFGRTIGKKFGLRITCGQALGQKNTILAIWMAQTFLSPVASLGPAAYVLWQNVFNSWQLYQNRKKPTLFNENKL